SENTAAKDGRKIPSDEKISRSGGGFHIDVPGNKKHAVTAENKRCFLYAIIRCYLILKHMQ
ncbi:hypothetical protein, partial [Citrobacter braakii]|uniref:hypothetical protein n=1 Tax=Citrobacter braakii TaxID=57706 RepID=UPI002447A31D